MTTKTNKEHSPIPLASHPRYGAEEVTLRLTAELSEALKRSDPDGDLMSAIGTALRAHARPHRKPVKRVSGMRRVSVISLMDRLPQA